MLLKIQTSMQFIRGVKLMPDNDDIVYPIPLSNGRVITIHNMPDNLSDEEVKKIQNIIKALAIKITEKEG